MVVRELLTKFGFSVDKSSMSSVEGSINRLSGMLGAIGGAISLKGIADIADTMQSLEARLGMLPQTIGNVGDSFDTVAQHATDARQSIEAYGTLYTRVGNAAKEYVKTQDDLLKVTDTISKALVVGGATMAEQSSVMLQFSQALGSGTLQGDEFRAMAEAAPQYLDALAKALGHPRSQLKKLASEGKITTKDIIKATMSMADEFNDKFNQMPLTIGQGITKAMNNFTLFISRLNRETKAVSKIANFIIDNFDKIGFAVAAALTPMILTGFVTALTAIMSPIGLLIGAVYLLYTSMFEVSKVTGRLQLTKLGKDMVALKYAMMPIMALLTAMAARFVVLRVVATATFIRMGVVAMSTAITMAEAWLMALGPVGWAIAGIVALITAVIVKWEAFKRLFTAEGWLGQSGNTESILPNYKKPNQAQTAQSGGYGQKPNVDARQNINITVPAGTPESQQQFIEKSAAKSFSEGNNARTARALGVFTL